MQVDDYPPETKDWRSKLDESADTKLDNPKFIFFGKNGMNAFIFPKQKTTSHV